MLEAHDEIEALGARLLVAFNADVALVEAWVRETDPPGGVLVGADPDAELYEALGTTRQGVVPLLAKSMLGGLRSARQGMLPSATRADMQRLGADVAVRADGEIALLHLAQSADDRIGPEPLLAALRT